MDLHLKQDLHSQHLSYAMGDSSFISIHEKDLPFGVRHNSRMKCHHFNVSSPKEAIPFKVGHVSKSREEGAWLMANLTGVQNVFHPKDDVGETAFSNLEETTKNKIRGLHRKSRPSNSTAVQSKKLLCLTELQQEYGTIVTVSERAQINQCSAKNKECIECVQMSDKSIDTGDLSFWTYVVPSHESLSSDDESESSFSLEKYENSSVNEALAEGRPRAQGGDYDKGHSMGYEEYMTRVKESVAYIQMRTQMLHDLGLGEDPKCDRTKSLIATGKPILEDKKKKEIDTSSMNSASIAVKQARQLAGLMHSDEQACDLHNIFTQLQYLGKLSADNGSYDALLKHGMTMAGATSTIDKMPNIGVEAKIGSSLFECLQQAHEGVQLILASIYHGKNNVLGHQAELILSDKPDNGNVDCQEHNLQKYLDWLLNLEDNYEVLGSTISNCLQEAKKLDYEREVAPTLFGELEVQSLQKEIMKLKKQLHFWRAKNWAENHQIQSPSETVPVYTFVNEPTTNSLIFYYDVHTGLNTMINLTELDPQIQNSIMKLAAKPVQLAKVLRLPDDKITALAPPTPIVGSRSFCPSSAPSAKFRAKSLGSACDSRRSIPCELKRT